MGVGTKDGHVNLRLVRGPRGIASVAYLAGGEVGLMVKAGFES